MSYRVQGSDDPGCVRGPGGCQSRVSLEADLEHAYQRIRALCEQIQHGPRVLYIEVGDKTANRLRTENCKLKEEVAILKQERADACERADKSELQRGDACKWVDRLREENKRLKAELDDVKKIARLLNQRDHAVADAVKTLTGNCRTPYIHADWPSR